MILPLGLLDVWPVKMAKVIYIGHFASEIGSACAVSRDL